MHEKICKNCRTAFMGGPRAWYCPSCRADRQKIYKRQTQERERTGTIRRIGSTDICVVCREQYIVASGTQKYCRQCAPDEVKKIDRIQGLEYYKANKDDINPARYERRRVDHKICSVCGMSFDPQGRPRTICPSEECRKISKRQWQKKADEKRALKRIAQT